MNDFPRRNGENTSLPDSISPNDLRILTQQLQVFSMKVCTDIGLLLTNEEPELPPAVGISVLRESAADLRKEYENIGRKFSQSHKDWYRAASKDGPLIKFGRIEFASWHEAFYQELLGRVYAFSNAVNATEPEERSRLANNLRHLTQEVAPAQLERECSNAVILLQGERTVPLKKRGGDRRSQTTKERASEAMTLYLRLIKEGYSLKNARTKVFSKFEISEATFYRWQKASKKQ